MNKSIVIILIALAVKLNAQVGMAFPFVAGKTLDDKPISLPIKNNKKTIVGIAYGRAAEGDLKKWLNPLYSTFIEKPDNKNFDVAAIYDVNFVFVPVIAGLKNVIEDFKKGTDKEFWPYIMDMESSDMQRIERELKAADRKTAYFYVLDTNGKIIEMVSGAFSDDKMDKLETAAE
jgi:hypothetical protein